jgi:hypothetical protein
MAEHRSCLRSDLTARQAISFGAGPYYRGRVVAYSCVRTAGERALQRCVGAWLGCEKTGKGEVFLA